MTAICQLQINKESIFVKKYSFITFVKCTSRNFKTTMLVKALNINNAFSVIVHFRVCGKNLSGNREIERDVFYRGNLLF